MKLKYKGEIISLTDDMLNTKIYAITECCTFIFIHNDKYNALDKDVKDNVEVVGENTDKTADELLDEKILFVKYDDLTIDLIDDVKLDVLRYTKDKQKIEFMEVL